MASVDFNINGEAALAEGSPRVHKALVGILAAGVSAAVVALSSDNSFSTVEIINICIAIVGAVGAF